MSRIYQYFSHEELQDKLEEAVSRVAELEAALACCYKAMGKAIDCDEVVSFSLPFDILSDAMSKASKHLKEQA